MDKGPWELSFDHPDKLRCDGVQSDDFEHDVLLRVSGDFADREERRAYCEWLRDTLNRRTDSAQEEGK